MPDYQNNRQITKDTRCWGIIVSYDSSDGQSANGKEDRLESLQNLTFSEAEQKAEELNKQLKDNT